jgi:putative aldouronate transport system permease protein
MQIFNLYNSSVYNTGDILDTYIYRLSFQTSIGFGVGSAVGVFKGVTNGILLVVANRIARAVGQKGIS